MQVIDKYRFVILLFFFLGLAMLISLGGKAKHSSRNHHSQEEFYYATEKPAIIKAGTPSIKGDSLLLEYEENWIKDELSTVY